MRPVGRATSRCRVGQCARPRGVPSGTSAMLAAATVAPTPRLHSSYTWFLTRTIPEYVTAADLPAVLTWAADNLETSELHGDAADALFVVDAAHPQHMDINAVARIDLRRSRVHGRQWGAAAAADLYLA